MGVPIVRFINRFHTCILLGYTSWVTETGEVLKPRAEGEQPMENFDSYEFVRTDKDDDGNITHVYRKVENLNPHRNHRKLRHLSNFRK